MEFYGSAPNILWLPCPGERTCSSYAIASYSGLGGDMSVLKGILWLTKMKEETDSSHVFDVGSTFLGSQKDSPFPLFWPFLFGRCGFPPPPPPVFLMELEINMAFCLPPNLCAAIINVVSIVLGIRFVYRFCWASKWRHAEKTVLHIRFQYRILFHS